MKKLIIATLLFAVSANADWKSDSELGLVSQAGNTVQDNTYAKTTMTKESGANAYTLHGSYINSAGKVGGVEIRTAESAQAGLRYTRALNENMGVFAGLLWEKNNFAGFEERWSGDLGLRYDFVKGDDFYFFNETGLRYRTQYAYISGSDKGPAVNGFFGRAYFELGKSLTERSKFKFWVENLYDFNESENYEVNFEPSIDVDLGELIDGARASLKIAYKGMFDNVPAIAGLERYDSIFSTSIKVLY